MITMDMVAMANGFEDAAEMNRMVARVDIQTDEELRKFTIWKETDGTKEGLEKLMEELSL